MSNYETVIVELAVYVDKDNYAHKNKTAREIVEEELGLIECDTGVYIERFISNKEIVEYDEEK
jgi:hypothetical protein|tara:strand:- start:5587 stop:5775 length:189 start_codon:yes stop_codon:yes gene_type:complete